MSTDPPISVDPNQSTDQVVADLDLLLDELSKLAELAADRRAFYDSLLRRTAQFVHSPAAVLWTLGPSGNLVFCQQFATEPAGSYQRDAGRAASALDAPGAGLIKSELGVQLIAAPIRVLDRPFGVLGIYRSAGESSEISQAYCPLIDAIAEIAREFETNQCVLEQVEQTEYVEAITQLSLNAHRSLNTQEVAVNIANDGRALMQCDRVGVFESSPWKIRLAACSGVATTDTRSSYVKLLRPLVKRVTKTQSPIVIHEHTQVVPRDLKRYFDSFPNQTHPAQFALIPLTSSASPARDSSVRAARSVGALVVESFEARDLAQFLRKLNALTEHAASAMSNAARFERIPMRWLWSGMRSFSDQLAPNRLARTAIVLGLLTAAILALVFVQTEFKVEVRGALRPVNERHVFSPRDGVVDQLLVEHGDLVEQGQPIVALRSPDLEMELRQLDGQMDTTRKKRDGLATILQATDSGNPEDTALQNRLAAELLETQASLTNLEARRAFLAEQLDALEIKSPIAGYVVTWNIEQRLHSRPVHRGESLLRIADVAGPWHVVFDVRDQKFGYIAAARQNQNRQDLPVSMTLASHPSARYTSRLQSTSMSSESRDGNESTVRLTAAIEQDHTPYFKPGTSVVGRVHCGQHNIVYVWTAEIVDSFRRRFYW